MARRRLPVGVEAGAKKTFAFAVDWPGLCRSGRDEDDALEALAAYGPRYGPVAAAAGLRPPTLEPASFEVVERLPGSTATDFGVPYAIGEVDRRPVSAAAGRRAAALVEAAWSTLGSVAAGAPASLRKGRRGGGRDRDAVVAHVVDAEQAYARKLGLRPPKARAGDADAVAAVRAAVLEVLGRAWTPTEEGPPWPPSYAARRIAWHALDHAWEIQDRS
ncbi:MAG: hypothetical protein KGJ77_05290 [Acidobacteriota bacterium]|nr:hypothetical protein [Acidobacteriota bacterium]